MNVLRFHPLVTRKLFRQPEGYRRKKPSGIWWRDKLSSWCWKLLHRLRTVEQFGFTEKVYDYGPAEQGKVTERIVKAINELYKGDAKPDDYCIVMGAIDFRDLMGDPVIIREGYYTVPAGEIGYSTRGYRGRFMDLPVHVVANLSGVALIPRVLIERKAAA
jgi:hypothetical protein